jgi:hypothetical protein
MVKLTFRRRVQVSLVNRQIPLNLPAVSLVNQQIPNLLAVYSVNQQTPLNLLAGSSVNPLRVSLQPPGARVYSVGSSLSSHSSSPVCLDSLSRLKRAERRPTLCLVV